MKTRKTTKTKPRTPRMTDDEYAGIAVQALLMHHVGALQFNDWSTEGDANWLHNRALTVIRYLTGAANGDEPPTLEDINRQYGERKTPVRVRAN